MVLKSSTLLQYRLPFDLDWLISQNFTSASPKFKRVLIDYASSGACGLQYSMAIVASLSPNFNLELNSLKALLSYFFENESLDLETLQMTLMPVIRQNFSTQHDFNFIILPLQKFQKSNNSRDTPRADFSFFVDFLEQQPAFELNLKRNSSLLEAFFVALIHNTDFARANYLVESFKLSPSCIEVFVCKFAAKLPVERTLALFSTLDIEAKIRVIRSNSSSTSLSQLMINCIAPDESAHRSSSLEEGLVKTLQKIILRKDAKAVIDFLKKVNVDSDDLSCDVIIVSNDCFLHLLYLALACVAKTGDIYLSGKIAMRVGLYNNNLNEPHLAEMLFKKMLLSLENVTPERVSTCSKPPIFEVWQRLYNQKL